MNDNIRLDTGQYLVPSARIGDIRGNELRPGVEVIRGTGVQVHLRMQRIHDHPATSLVGETSGKSGPDESCAARDEDSSDFHYLNLAFFRGEPFTSTLPPITPTAA